MNDELKQQQETEEKPRRWRVSWFLIGASIGIFISMLPRIHSGSRSAHLQQQATELLTYFGIGFALGLLIDVVLMIFRRQKPQFSLRSLFSLVLCVALAMIVLRLYMAMMDASHVAD